MKTFAGIFAAVFVLVGIRFSGPVAFAVIVLGVPTALYVVGLERRKPAAEERASDA
jgi:hypothetical protein